MAIDPTATDLHQSKDVMEAGFGARLPEFGKSLGVGPQCKAPRRLAAWALYDRYDVPLVESQVKFVTAHLDEHGFGKQPAEAQQMRRYLKACLYVREGVDHLGLPCVNKLSKSCHDREPVGHTGKGMGQYSTLRSLEKHRFTGLGLPSVSSNTVVGIGEICGLGKVCIATRGSQATRNRIYRLPGGGTTHGHRQPTQHHRRRDREPR